MVRQMTDAVPRPFERSYWVVPGRLLAGCYPGELDALAAAAKLARLLDAGVRCVITLIEAEETGRGGLPFAPYEPVLDALAAARGARVEIERHAIRDMDVPSVAEMRQTLDAIDARLAAGKPVYIHCWGGYGRTGTVVGCWLARHGPATGPGALRRLCELRTGLKGESPQTDAQRAMVAEWQAGD
jgi:hypothetical protein